MAIITITIEDSQDGKVKTTFEPSIEIISKMINSGNDITSAHGYALVAANAIIKSSKDEKDKIWQERARMSNIIIP